MILSENPVSKKGLGNFLQSHLQVCFILFILNDSVCNIVEVDFNTSPMSPTTIYIIPKCVSVSECIWKHERGGLCFFVHVCVYAAVCLSWLGNRGSAHAFNQATFALPDDCTLPPPLSFPLTASLPFSGTVSLCCRGNGPLAPHGGGDRAHKASHITYCIFICFHWLKPSTFSQVFSFCIHSTSKSQTFRGYYNIYFPR